MSEIAKYRVAQVLAGAEFGGAENFFVRLVSGLHASGRGEQAAFIRRHQHRIDALRSVGVDVRGFRFGRRLNFLDRHRYLKALREFSPEIVMTWMNRASGLTPKGPYTLVSRLGHYYNLKYYRHADYWIGISKGICEHLVSGGMPAAKVFHIPNFADETPVSPLPRDSFETPAGPLLLAAGRLHVNKGFDVLLKALVQIPDATLWLAGSGPEESSLKALCADLNLNHRVRFLGWRSDVTSLMKTADMFICPSRHEGLGSIVMESWAHGCPIVATASQGPGELVDDGMTGILTPVDDVSALSEGILAVMHNPQLASSLAEGGAQEYQSKYSRQVVVRQYEELYAALLKR